jgi:hypothetical protein
MDEYEKMMEKQGQYALVDFNKRCNLTASSGFLNTRGTGVAPRNVEAESRLRNIQLKNTKDQDLKKNPFNFQSQSKFNVDNSLEPAFTRERKTCSDISDISYIQYTFQPNLQNPQEFVKFDVGVDTRHESR